MTAEGPVLGRVSSLGALTAWRRVVIDFDGPYRSENPATYRDYRLELSLTHADAGETLLAPGYFAADGRAGETGASSGGVWRVAFAPPRDGLWRYRARFRAGPDAAILPWSEALDVWGDPVSPIDGATGSIDIGKPGRPGETAEGSADLGGAGPLQARDGKAAFPNIGLERPGAVLGDWSSLLASSAFDDPASGEDGRPFISAAGLGAASAQDAPAYSGALRLVERMAEEAGRRGAGFVRLELFPSELGEFAAGPWKRTAQLGRAGGDPLCFDVSRFDQWQALMERLMARGVGVELMLDPPDPDATAAFWTAPEMRTARRLMLRELAARFSGVQAMIWRASLAEDDRAFLAALDPTRVVARTEGEAFSPAEAHGSEDAEMLRPPEGAALPEEADAVSTRSRPEEGGALGLAAQDDAPVKAQESSEPEPAATQPPPQSSAESFLEGAGAAAATAVRQLSGLLKDVARAAEPSSPAQQSSGPSEVNRSNEPANITAQAETSGGGSAFTEGATPNRDETGEGAEGLQDEEPSPPPSSEAGEAKPNLAPVVLAAAPPRRLTVSDLETSSGPCAVEMALFRLDDSADSPEAEPIAASLEETGGAGLDLSHFEDGGASMIVRLSGADAGRVRNIRVWGRRLQNASDALEPTDPGEDPRQIGPAPLLEAAEPFALFTDLDELALACRNGPSQLVLEALGPATFEAGEVDAEVKGSGQVLCRRAFPVACAGGIANALIALSRRAASPTDSPSAPESGAGEKGLTPDLEDRIQNAPVTEQPGAPSESDKMAQEDAGSDAGGEPIGAAEAVQPPAEPAGDGEDGRPKRDRPVYFGALVSEARRKEAARRATEGGRRRPTLEEIAAKRVSDAAAQATGEESAEPADTGLSREGDGSAADEIVPNAAVEPSGDGGGLSLRRLELIDAETDRRIATLREGAQLASEAALGKRITVKATLAGVDAAKVARVRMTLEGEELAQRAVDRPQPAEEECIGMFYGLIFHEGWSEIRIEAMGEDEALAEPLLVARRSFAIGD